MKLARLVCLVWCILSFSSFVSAKDVWINVRSKNFNMVGNAGEKDIRAAATRLEQFREVFRLLLPKLKFDSYTPTTVVVFKSQNSYKPYLPVRADGKADTGIAGYFQPGDDVNYITLSTEGESKETYSTIFHEYTHFMVNNNLGKTVVPPWFNEGLAEYYETFRIEKDQEVNLGDLQDNYLYLLNQSKMIPLEQFFSIDNYSLHRNGGHGRSVFYGQAWALMHYLGQGDKGIHQPELQKFINAVLQKKPAKEAFEEAFQMNYAAMEKVLKNYVAKQSFFGSKFTLKQKLTFDAEMQTFPMSEAEAEADAYLGDLLLHSNRLDEAQKKLKEAVALEANQPLALSALGTAQAKQRNFAEAEVNLEKAIALNPKNYLVFYNYANALNQQTLDSNNFASNVSETKIESMRNALKKSIELNPNFPESYHLLGFTDLISGQNLEEGVGAVKKALSLQPGSQHHAIILVQLYARQENFDAASALATKLKETAEDEGIRSLAEMVLGNLQKQREYAEKRKQYQAEQEKYESGGGNGGNGERHEVIIEQDGSTTPEEAMNKALNQVLRKPQGGEQRVTGSLTAIECGKGQTFVVRGDDGKVLRLRIADFQALKMTAYTPDMNGIQVGCGAIKAENFAIVTFKPTADAKSKTDGEIVALEFMPKTFKLMP